nr:hypothetical protein [Elusimicrobiota bacterium]
RFSVYNNRVSGPGSGNSFLARGTRYQDNLSLNLDSEREAAEGWSLALDLLVTDDDSVDHKKVVARRVSYDRRSPGRQVTAGDLYGNFTQYSLNQSVKGLRWVERQGAAVEVSAVAGLVKNRWDELFEKGSYEVLNREVEGVRARWTGPMASEIGAQAVLTQDQRVPGATADAYRQRLFGFNWALPSNSDLSVSGESAWSGVGIDKHNAADSSRSDSAHRVSVRLKAGPWSSSNEYENVGPGFTTTVGAAAPDLRRWLTRNRVRVAPGMDALVNLSGYRNNLDGAQPDTVRALSPEAGLRWSAAFNRPTLDLEARVRQRRAVHSSATAEQRELSGILSLSDRWGPLSGTFDYEHRNEERVGQQKNSRDLFGFGLSGFYRLRDVILRPSVKWNLERDRDRTASVYNATAQSYLGLSAENLAPGVSASFSYRRSSALQAGADDVMRGVLDLRCNYKVPWREGDSLEAGYRSGVNDFSTSSKNYRERVWEAAYVAKL